MSTVLLLLGSFHFYDGVLCVLWKCGTLVCSVLFPQLSSHPRVFYGRVLCPCSVVIHHQVQQRWFVSYFESTGSNESRVSALCLILWHELRLWTSKTAAFHMLEDVIQWWWVITSRTWECLYGTGPVALGGRWREWQSVKMEENEEGCMVAFIRLILG